jgi:hypothetical protein
VVQGTGSAPQVQIATDAGGFYRLALNGAWLGSTRLPGPTVTTPIALGPGQYAYALSQTLPQGWGVGATGVLQLAGASSGIDRYGRPAQAVSVQQQWGGQASATPLARVPTLNPVTARLPGWNHRPAETAQLTLRGPLGEVIETRELPIELLVYDTDDDGDRMRAREYFVFGMRLLEGIDPSVFQRETGFELAALVGPTMARDVAAGFFVNRAGRWQLTETGLAVSDGLWPDYLSEQTEPADHDCIHYA